MRVPRLHGVVRNADTSGAGQHNGTAKFADLVDQRAPGHLPRPIRDKGACVDKSQVSVALRKNCGDAGAYRTFACDEWAVPLNESDLPYFDTGDIGDGVKRSGIAVEGDACFACARTRNYCHGKPQRSNQANRRATVLVNHARTPQQINHWIGF